MRCALLLMPTPNRNPALFSLSDASRVLLGALFIGAGALHFTRTDTYLSIMPSYLPLKRELVLLSGAGEIAGGAGVLLAPPLRRWAGWGLIALLVAVFPANVEMIRRPLEVNGAPRFPASLLWARLPLQAALIAWVWKVAASRPSAPKG